MECRRAAASQMCVRLMTRMTRSLLGARAVHQVLMCCCLGGTLSWLCWLSADPGPLWSRGPSPGRPADRRASGRCSRPAWAALQKRCLHLALRTLLAAGWLPLVAPACAPGCASALHRKPGACAPATCACGCTFGCAFGGAFGCAFGCASAFRFGQPKPRARALRPPYERGARSRYFGMRPPTCALRRLGTRVPYALRGSGLRLRLPRF